MSADRPARTRCPSRVRCSALALSLLVSGCIPMDDAIQAIFGRSMRDQPSFDPYENPQPPPEDAVPFASGNHPAAPDQVSFGQPEGLAQDIPPFTATDMARGGELANALTNPVAATAESLARGQEMYNRMCAVCHGPEGNPQQAAILPKLPAMVAFPLASGAALLRSDGYIYGMIAVGRGIMPPYGHQVSFFDRWHVVNYIRLVQGRVPPGGVEGPPGSGAGR